MRFRRRNIGRVNMSLVILALLLQNDCVAVHALRNQQVPLNRLPLRVIIKVVVAEALLATHLREIGDRQVRLGISTTGTMRCKDPIHLHFFLQSLPHFAPTASWNPDRCSASWSFQSSFLTLNHDVKTQTARPKAQVSQRLPCSFFKTPEFCNCQVVL